MPSWTHAHHHHEGAIDGHHHDLAPDPESIDWGTVGSMEKTREDLQALSDWLFEEGEYAA